MPPNADLPQKQHRFFKQRIVIVPTWRIIVPIIAIVALVAGLFLKNAYHWLAVTAPLSKAPYAIVEGWAPDYALKSAADEILRDHVTLAFCTGVPIDRGTMVHSYGTYANYAKETLIRMEVPSEKLIPVPAEISRTERTRMMARAVKSRLAGMDIPDGRKRINLFTVGTHARRSRAIYQDELGKGWQVGVISIADQEADPDRWFLQSVGAKYVINEMVALTLGLFGAN